MLFVTVVLYNASLTNSSSDFLFVALDNTEMCWCVVNVMTKLFQLIWQKQRGLCTNWTLCCRIEIIFSVCIVFVCRFDIFLSCSLKCGTDETNPCHQLGLVQIVLFKAVCQTKKWPVLPPSVTQHTCFCACAHASAHMTKLQERRWGPRQPGRTLLT